MVHSLKLQLQPFVKIKGGKKTIEVRLYDEKRQLITVDDEIEFVLTVDPHQTFHAKVVDLVRFKTFEELFRAYPPEVFGAEKSEDWINMYQYYTKEQEEKYGVLGIRIELTD